MSPADPMLSAHGTEGESDAANHIRHLPAWVPFVTVALAVAGLAVSVYLTIAHFTSPAVLVCANNAAISCEKVTTSPQSQVFGIPVAVLGVAFFLVMIAFTTPVAWRSGSATLQWGRFLWASVGLLFVVYLVSAELLLLHTICLWCTAVHVLTLALFIVITVAMTRRTPSRDQAVEAPADGHDGAQ